MLNLVNKVATVLLFISILEFSHAFKTRDRSLKQSFEPGSRDQGSEIVPVGANVGTEVPLTYFGPAPSQVLKELVGPFQLLKSGM